MKGMILCLLACSLLTACSSTINMDKAIEIAKKEVGFSEASSVVEKSFKDDRYTVILEENGDSMRVVLDDDGSIEIIESVNTNSPVIATPEVQTRPNNDAVTEEHESNSNNETNVSGCDFTVEDVYALVDASVFNQFDISLTTICDLKSYDYRDDQRDFTKVEFSDGANRYEVTLYQGVLDELEVKVPYVDRSSISLTQDEVFAKVLKYANATAENTTIYEQEYDRDDKEYSYEGVFNNVFLEIAVYENGQLAKIEYR